MGEWLPFGVVKATSIFLPDPGPEGPDDPKVLIRTSKRSAKNVIVLKASITIPKATVEI
jgi:hypothetical protein